MQQPRYQQLFLTSAGAIALALMAVGFFYPVKLFEGSYLFDAWWNLGHVVFFSFFSYTLLTVLARWSSRVLTLAVIIVCFLLGLGIEFIQSFIGRESSWSDASLNALGTGCGSFWFYRQTKYPGRVISCVMLLAGLTLAIWPGTRELLNAIYANHQFPVLLANDSAIERVRLQGNKDAILEWKATGVLISLSTRKRSGFDFNRFPKDWSAYKELAITFVNNSDQPLLIHCKIQDSREYLKAKDRYNRRKSLPTGKTTLEIPLVDILNAPRKRKMDLTSIQLLSCYSPIHNQPGTLLLKEIRLL